MQNVGMSGPMRLSAKQLRAMASSKRLAILAALRAGGPQSILDLSASLSVEPKGLYYHIRALVEHGLIELDSVRRGVRREEAVYAAVGRRFEIDFCSDSAEVRDAGADLTQTLVRQNARLWQSAAQSLPASDWRRSGLWLDTINCRLTEPQIVEMKSRFQELFDWATSQEQGTSGARVCVTVFGSPVLSKLPPDA